MLQFLANRVGPLAVIDFLLQFDGNRIAFVIPVAVCPHFLYLDISTGIILSGHGIAGMINILAVIRCAVRGHLECVVESCEHVFRRSLDLTQIVSCVLLDGPSVSSLVAFDGEQAIFISDENEIIRIALHAIPLGSLNRFFIRVKQLEFGSGKPLGHIAGFVFHEVDSGN